MRVEVEGGLHHVITRWVDRQDILHDERDQAKLLAFHAFPSQHARHLRTTNPIESPFAAVKLRTNVTMRIRSSRSALHWFFKLLQRSEKGWQRLSHPEKLKEVQLPNNPT
jgi:transposase-like protein